MTITLKSLGKHPYWPWQMTFLFFYVLNAFLTSSCIFVQRRKCLRWRYVKMFGDLWPFASKSKIAASFCRSGFKYGVRSLNTQHFHSYCTYKNVLFMDQSDLHSRTIDLNLYGNLPIEILYQYEYVVQLEKLNYGTITTRLRNGFAYQCEIP